MIERSLLERETMMFDSTMLEAHRSLAANGETDVLTLLEWFKESSEIAYSRANPMDLTQTVLHRPSGDPTKVALLFVEEGNSVTRQYPILREQPSYMPNLNSIACPFEVLANPAVASAVLVHETVHAQDLLFPDVAKASSVYPETDIGSALGFLTEIRAFDYEGKVLVAMLGEEFGDYVKEQIKNTFRAALKERAENARLAIEVRLENEDIFKHLTQNMDFVREADGLLALGLIAPALATYIGMRAFDKFVAANPEDGFSELEVLGMKANLLPESYY